MKKRNRIYRKGIRTKNATKKEGLYNFFKSYKNYLNKVARLSKVNHYKTFFEDNKNKINKVSATYIKSLKNNKSNGPFSISNKLFKKFKKPLSTPLTLLINLTFTKGKFPDILKIGKIFPIHLKNCKTDVNNYRPISLLPNISKIIEKIVHDQLYMYLENNNIFYKYQFGFRANHSTNHALTEITEQIRNACDKGL